MLRALIAASVVLGGITAQEMPVATLSGGRQVSAQPPSAPPASPSPGQLPPLSVTQIDPRQVTLDSPRRLTLSFAEPRPIDEVLALLTMGTGFSLAIDTDATGSFRGELKQLTLREALTTLLAPLGLEFQVHGTVIRVRRRQMESRVFDLDLLNVQRGMARSSGTAAASVSTVVNSDDVMAGVADGVRALLSERGTAHVDRRAGVLQVTDFQERIDRVALYVETLQQRSARQVRLQAQAFEVTLRDGGSVDWRKVRERLGVPADSPQAGIAGDPIALRAALAAQGDVRTLWAPEVTAINNEPALMRIATPGGTSLTITIVPQISADGIVQMSVSHAWEEHAGDRKSGWFSSTPIGRIAEADSVMRVMDGNSAVLAGILRPQEIAVASTSGFGSLFGAQSKRMGHAELIVLLRPTVVTAGTFSASGSR